MVDREKVWVIETEDDPVVKNLGDALKGTGGHGKGSPAPRSAKRAARPAGPPPEPPGPLKRLHSAIRLGLAYVAGPAGILLTRRGRRSGLATALAGLCSAVIPVIAAGWWAVRAGRVETGVVPALALGTVGTALVAFSVWARSLHLFASAERRATRDWPAALRQPLLAGVYGVVAPGAAQIVAQRPRRAVLTLWSAWPFVAAVVVTLNASLIWSQRAGFDRWGLDAAAVERTLLVAAVLTLLAPLFWLAQTLEGTRALAVAAGSRRALPGDWSALALVGCLAAAAVASDPQTIAAELAAQAEELAAHECVVAPVALAATAHRLDPGEPAYALQLAAYHTAAGDLAAARHVRADLDRTMQAYLSALRHEGRLPRSTTAQVERESVLARAARAAMFLGPPAPIPDGGAADDDPAPDGPPRRAGP